MMRPMSRLTAGIAFVGAILAGCASPGDEVSPSARRANERAIHALLTAQQQAWNLGDIRGFMEGYWRSDDLVFTSGGAIRRGWQAALEGYERHYDTPEKMGRLEFSELEFTHVSPDAVLVLGRWELFGLPEKAGGRFTLLLRHFPEGWRIVHDHTSSVAGEP